MPWLEGPHEDGSRARGGGLNLIRGLLTTLLLRKLGAVVSHAAIAIVMAMLWIDPTVFGLGAARQVEFMLVLEFLALHSTAFLVGFRFIKNFPRWIFIVVYTPFALVLGAAMSSHLVAILFVWHLASGVWGDFDTAERNVGIFLMRYVPAFLWFVIVPVAVLLLRLPALGWEAYPGLAFRTDEGFRSAALFPAWATLYFAGRSYWEYALRRWESTGALDRFLTAVQKT